MLYTYVKTYELHTYVLGFFLEFFHRYGRVSAQNYCPAFVTAAFVHSAAEYK